MSRHEPFADVYATAPPPEETRESTAQRLKRRLVDGISAALLPAVKAVARPYIGGDSIDDAVCVAARLVGEGYALTLGFWDSGKEGAEAIAKVDRDAIGRLSAHGWDGYVSLKPPALHYAPAHAQALADEALALGIGLHGDSHGVEAADPSNAMLQLLIDRLGGAQVGTTLPGRWTRSLRDADWAVERGLNVRVVKGQWPDPDQPKSDMAKGFLAVIDRLAGRARKVAVATHDLPLARESIERLRAAGTDCELEVLFGMPAKHAIRWAQENRIKVRIYVPFGEGFVPSALRVLKRNPRLAVAIAKERALCLFRRENGG